MCRIIIAIIITFSSAFSQKINVNGYIKDSTSTEILVGVTIFTLNGKYHNISNKYGYYNLNLPKNEDIKIKFSFTGYKSEIIEVNAKKDTSINISLFFAENQLNEVIVKGTNKFITSNAGFVNIPIETLKNIPVLFGEKDIIKALSLTPGVSTGNEGTTGLIVRGGTPDQNLILLDDATVYNTAHLFGLVSIFNAEAIKNVDLYKAGFPARFGGRLSSVLDITMNDGNNAKKKVERTLGLVSSSMLWQGPTNIKLKYLLSSSYLIAARTSYITPFILPKYLLFRAGKVDNYFNYWLYDINTKINFNFRKNNQLFLSLYNGNDFWVIQDGITADRSKVALNWGNLTGTIRYNHILHPKLLFNTVISGSKYSYSLNNFIYQKINNKWKEDDFIKTQSTINDITNKINFEWLIGQNHTLKFGIKNTAYVFNPLILKSSFEIENDTTRYKDNKLYMYENGNYFETESKLFDFITVNIGGRFNLVKVKEKTYKNFEPRINGNLNISEHLAIKGAYTQMNQYMHILSNNSVGLPNDIWVPSTKDIPASFSSQYTIGIDKVFEKNINVSIEFYKKKFNYLIDYKDNSGFYSNVARNWQENIEKNGIGQILGAELFINKTKGIWRGWFGYTLSKNIRKFENINEGKWYNSNFDRRHMINFVASYSFPTNHNTFSFSWIYNSGAPITLPISVYKQFNENKTNNFGKPIFIYGDRNNVRLPNYHRLDLSYTFNQTSVNNRKSSFTLGAYNAYNRVNPFYIKMYYQPNPIPNSIYDSYQGFTSEAKKVGVLPIIPYFSYNVKIK